MPTPRLLGVSGRWCCFGSHALTDGGVGDAVVPCGLGGSSLATWVRDFNFEGSCRIRPELKELDDQQFFAIEGSCRSRPALEELDVQEFFAIEGS